MQRRSDRIQSSSNKKIYQLNRCCTKKQNPTLKKQKIIQRMDKKTLAKLQSVKILRRMAKSGSASKNLPVKPFRQHRTWRHHQRLGRTID
jgi:hypothetical protein